MPNLGIVLVPKHKVKTFYLGTKVSAGADPGFFLGGSALVSCSTSTPINHIVFFLDPPLALAPCIHTF